MMQNLRLGGVLSSISGLIVGQFSDCTEDPRMMKTIKEIIADAVSSYNYPVCFNFQAGHVDNNLPLVMGSNVSLEVHNEASVLRFTDKL
jgi:muramoyltetrapeptide carboxypeptidase